MSSPRGVLSRGQSAFCMPWYCPMSPPTDPALAAAPAADSTQLVSGLARKIVLAVIIGALVFAALAMYGDVRELRRTARAFAPGAFVLGLVLAAGNYGL